MPGINRDPFVQGLRNAHRALRAKAELARGFLLQGGGNKRRGWAALPIFALDINDFERAERACALRARMLKQLDTSGICTAAFVQVELS